jgi:hypothetical protein
MSHPSLRRWLPLAAAAGAATVCGTTMPAMAAPGSPIRPPPARAGGLPATAGGSATKPLLLINGDRLLAHRPPGGGSVLAVPRATGQQDFVGLPLDGQNLEIPATALPYLGHGLDPSLFDMAALEHAESGGRLPVRVTFTGHRPVLPGVTVTRTGRRAEQGYLTAAGARLFGAALARQSAAGHARGRNGRRGLLPGGTQIALAGAAAAVPAEQPRHAGTLVPLTMAGANLKGQPDNGDEVVVINADNARTFEGHANFHDGTAKFSVPAGPYWAIAYFVTPGPGPGTTRAVHMVVLPQFAVRHAATVAIGARSAISKISFATPRPAGTQMLWFTLVRGERQGPPVTLTAQSVGPGFSMWVSPTTKRPSVGTLRTYTEGQALSPAKAPGVPYAYDLDFAGPDGIIPAQRWRPAPGGVATVTERYYQDVPSTGDWYVYGGFRVQLAQAHTFGLIAGLFPLHLPGRQVQTFTAGLATAWSSAYDAFEPPSAGQGDGQQAGPLGPGFRTLPAGRHLTVDWNAYPLHPQPDAQPLRGAWPFLIAAQFPSAFRVGNTLTLYVTPFSDNYPDHLANAKYPLAGTKVTGHYAIYQNGKLIAHGKPIGNTGGLRVVPVVTLSGRPSVIRYALSVSRSGPHFRLSTASHTVWTWRSALKPTATVPHGWFCFSKRGYTAPHCAAQPMMTLGYDVYGLALDGRAPAGQQVIGLAVGHIQPGAQSRVTGASAKVSVNGGHTWQPATVTAQGGGRFRIAFLAPAGSFVTLRVHATDTAGGSVTETIKRAYGIAS